MNAIKAKGIDFERLPCHLALRAVVDSNSRQEAVKTLETAGVASACHILVADATGGVGLECSAQDIVQLPMENGTVTHTNHFIVPHTGPKSKLFLPDSPFRLERIRQLIADVHGPPSVQSIDMILQDEKNYPTAICRAETEKSTVATLFSIVMDLKRRVASVKIGRPTSPTGELELNLSS